MFTRGYVLLQHNILAAAKITQVSGVHFLTVVDNLKNLPVRPFVIHRLYVNIHLFNQFLPTLPSTPAFIGREKKASFTADFLQELVN